MDDRTLIRWKLKTNHLTSVWLINQLEAHGVKTDKAEATNTLNGSRKGPKVDEIIRVSLEILEHYEKVMDQGSA